MELFCYQAKKWIGAYAAALGGVETIVFAGGFGENAPVVCKGICAGPAFLGVKIDSRRNGKSAALSSGRVNVRVLRTDEKLMLARAVGRVLGPD